MVPSPPLPCLYHPYTLAFTTHIRWCTILRLFQWCVSVNLTVAWRMVPPASLTLLPIYSGALSSVYVALKNKIKNDKRYRGGWCPPLPWLDYPRTRTNAHTHPLIIYTGSKQIYLLVGNVDAVREASCVDEAVLVPIWRSTNIQIQNKVIYM